jgi:hypothetical protein
MNPSKDPSLNEPAFIDPNDRLQVVKIIQEYCTLEDLFYVRRRLFDIFQRALAADQKADCYSDEYSQEFFYLCELIKVVEACYLLRDGIHNRSIVIHSE